MSTVRATGADGQARNWWLLADEVIKAFAEERLRDGTVLFPVRLDKEAFYNPTKRAGCQRGGSDEFTTIAGHRSPSPSSFECRLLLRQKHGDAAKLPIGALLADIGTLADAGE